MARINWVAIAITFVAVSGVAPRCSLASEFTSCQDDPQISQRIAKYRAAGEPVTADDLRPPDVADADNAVIELRQASALLPDINNKYSAFSRYYEGDHGFPMTEKEEALAIQAARELSTVPELVDKAMAKKSFRWPTEPSSPLIDLLLPDLSQQRHLAIFLNMEAMLDHGQGRDGAAIADVRRTLFLGDALDHELPFLVVKVVGTAVRALACNMVRKIEPTLKIGDGPDAAKPQAVADLIGQLLRASDALGPSYRRSFSEERVGLMDAADSVGASRLDVAKLTGGDNRLRADPKEANSLLRDSIPEDLPKMLDSLTQSGDAANSPDWPAAQKKLPADLNFRADPMIHMFGSIMMGSMDRPVRIRFRAATDLRVAATCLAIRLYQADHQGDRPATLEALVPKYLPTLPADPMSADHASLRYVPQDDDPLVYSLCEDGTDGGGGEIDQQSKWASVIHLRQQPRDTSHLPADLKD
jgi:hypothetical protein